MTPMFPEAVRAPSLIAARASTLPLVEELGRRLEPWDAFPAVRALPFPIFFDSALRQATLGRYSYVTADPFAVLRYRGRRGEWRVRARGLPEPKPDPFSTLQEALGRFPGTNLPGLPPFQGGAAGLFGYDLCHHIERLPRPEFDDFAIPDLVIGFYDWVFAYDHVEERGWLISTGYPETKADRRTHRARDRLNQARALFSGKPNQPSDRSVLVFRARPAPLTTHRSPLTPASQYPMPQLAGLTSNFSGERFLDVVRRGIEYVHAGDCFQVNLAQRLLYPLREHPMEIYRKLRERNPATFAGYFDLGDFVLASASPERFLRLAPPLSPPSDGGDKGGVVETRPIKGTRPRGRTADEDHAQIEALRQSAKDRAENVMIVDLLRNDLGRVCEYGSIHVPRLCEVESYRTVHHLVSTVVGRLRPDKSAIDLLRAAFPGGSVTGAPKVRAMEIIAELEPTARGPYCGALGWLGFDGAMDTSILIRTFTIGKGWVQFPVGGGIVADSDPEREYEETLHKAEGLLRALQ